VQGPPPVTAVEAIGYLATLSSRRVATDASLDRRPSPDPEHPLCVAAGQLNCGKRVLRSIHRTYDYYGS